MKLYTVLLTFDDASVGIEQFETESPEQALINFVLNAESLKYHDRELILSIVSARNTQGNLLIHVANGLKGCWITSFGADFIEIPILSNIFGGHIIQSDTYAPVRSS